MQTKTKISALLAVLLLAACGTTPDEQGSEANSGGDAWEGEQGAQSGGLNTSGVGGNEQAEASQIDQQIARDENLRRQRVIYFDYDSSQIRTDFLPVLDAHARYLRSNPEARLRLEGHSDERGTREYNIALGERRGEAVRRALLLRGATRSQLLVVSYGEERPASLASGEAAWSQNRRVGLFYQ